MASQCRAAGWEIAIVDSRPFGDTCALRGCDPKKVLVGAAEVIGWSRRMKGKGIEADGSGIAWPELMRFKRSFTEPVPKSEEAGFAKAGIASFHGRARFVERNALPSATRFSPAVRRGGHRREAGGPEDRGPGARDDERPVHISFEFAHVAVRAGARVTVLHRGERPLEKFDPDLVNQLVKHTRELGIDVRLETQVEAVEKKSGHLRVRARTSGQAQTFEADRVVHGAGRVPEIDDLDLRTAGVEYERGVQVNQYLQSVSNPVVYAAGDAVASGGFPLTPVAGYQGRIVAENLLNGNHRAAQYPPIHR